ncbi:MAG: RagB/SusD family nutrient uptake outer membrane protein [Phaeodactylibacter sp.]|nr:RagB/SusD family nutrient uptake outer membrane protein [Phaeodactylibacter sp.]MCB9050879.1 RagB/SusD family nutrient uptake outer membrane protein [Lewinellaceae bacterium]
MKGFFNMKILLAVGISLFIVTSCKDEFLDFTPAGVVSDVDLNTVENAEKMVIAAYASLGNDGLLAHQYQDMWVYGSVRSDDAYKGGGSIGDQFDSHLVEVFSINTPANGNANLMWTYLYAGISRVNDAIRRIQGLDEAEYQAEAGVSRAQRIAEMRFVRGHYEFILKILFKFPVFIDETVPKTEVGNISNRELTDQEGWAYIVEEFRAALSALPDSQAEEGRPTKNAARAYLAKALLYKAYVQDDQHQVKSITASELEEVVDLVTTIEGTGEYSLYDDYAKNFLWEFESGNESVWAIMRSIDDGSPEGRGNFSTGLTSSLGPGYGCCSFNHASQNLANAYKTDDNGLPLFDTFNEGPQIETAEDVNGNNIDPRIAHTIGIIGMPFKYDPNRIYDETYARVPGVYGYKLGMKDQELPDCPCFRQYQAFFSISRNTDQIRYGDLLLMKAEALIELNRLGEALLIINAIRERAGSDASTSRLVFADGSPTGKWNVGTYQSLGDQENARKILRWERRLELAFESKRFFDLVRWGIAAETLNDYFASEKLRRDYLIDARFTAGRDEYLAIPQQQITISRGLYVQNPGYN